MIRQTEDFDRLLLAMDRSEWLADERFVTPEDRLANHEILTRMMREVIAAHSSAEWLEIFQAHDLPVALVAEFQDLPADPQVLADELAGVPREDLGLGRVIHDPINVDGVARVGARRAPEPGEHAEEIMAELGYTADAIARLRENGVI